jgi:hypothetical protein
MATTPRTAGPQKDHAYRHWVRSVKEMYSAWYPAPVSFSEADCTGWSENRARSGAGAVGFRPAECSEVGCTVL